MEVTLTFVRHGETVANRAHIVQGHKDYKLNENGIAQARKCAKALRYDHFDEAYSSDLARAFDTCAVIAEENRALGGAKAINRWPLMRERTFGVYEGRSFEQWNKSARHAGCKPGELWEFTPFMAESLRQLRDRAGEFFDCLVEDLASKWTAGDDPSILIVGHGVFLKELMIHLAEERKIPMPGKHKQYSQVPPNCSVTQLTVMYGKNNELKRVKCDALHSIDHLEGLEALAVKNYK